MKLKTKFQSCLCDGVLITYFSIISYEKDVHLLLALQPGLAIVLPYF